MQNQQAQIRKTQTRTPATSQSKSIQSSNKIGYGFGINAVAQLVAMYLIHAGVPSSQAYSYAYCGVIVVGILLLLPFHLESLLIDEKQSDQASISTPKHPPSLPGKAGFTDSHPLKVQLLAMVGGHHPTATRLLNQVMRENPGKTVDWYYDKVIQDLIRDRR